jgi:hypothetical protein
MSSPQRRAFSVAKGVTSGEVSGMSIVGRAGRVERTAGATRKRAAHRHSGH